MKIRDSGMLKEIVWETFFKNEEILKIMELNHNITNVAEFGSGYGTFTIQHQK